MHTPISISLFSEQILGARLYKDLWLNNQYKVIIFHEVHLWCLRKVFYGTIPPPKSHTICFFLHTVRILAMTFFLFKEKKKRKGESYIDWIFQWLSVYRDLYSSSSSWLAAGNSCEEEPSSVLETHCQPDETTMERHIFDDAAKMVRSQESNDQISECFTWYNK